MELKVAVFDLDGVLVKAKSIFYEIDRKVMKEMTGKDINRKEYEELGLKCDSNWAVIYNYYGISDHDKAYQRYYALEQNHPAQAMPYVHFALELFVKNTSCHILTRNPNRTSVMNKLETAGILKYFSHKQIHLSDHEKHTQLAEICKKEWLTSPEQCYFFTDMRKDIIDGKSAGVTTVGVAQKARDPDRESAETYEQLQFVKPDFMFTDFYRTVGLLNNHIDD